MSELADRQRWSSTDLLANALDTEAGLASIGSGSKGNGTVVVLGEGRFLVDCGFPLRTVESRLQQLGLRPGDLDAIFVSHEHSDHASGVAALAHKYAIPVYASFGTREAVRGGLPAKIMRPDAKVEIAGVEISSITVPHDAREPTQFVFERNNYRLGVLSDLGHITPHVVEHYSRLNGLLMEANHDPELLRKGRYPQSVKRRVAGNFGHLSNAQALSLLDKIAHPDLHVVIGHISEANNCLDRLNQLLEPMQERVASLRLADQQQGHPWVKL